MRIPAIALAVLAFAPAFAATSTYQLILERDTTTAGQTDLFLITFPTLDDFVNADNFTQFASEIPLNPGFSVGGFAYDGFPGSSEPPPPAVIPLPSTSMLILLSGILALANRRRSP
jgi:hypothetical protein